ncbi:hypothetical protein BCR32DRAFT_81233 [Anaeromyces robustus]|uniref:Uncharacterized protein n=1 Tax=Anaeromyces robustus TaxID=1754192 RepID=A0A1Y1WS63_9FUNG|nr:hypothetical protein BCR32DRAFT_81233 [Anaeromyces robustus]|eukprot:ORX76380.1 hypothetical protein BCR32DRAFT_81233 [Anaeromyces robustus]
MLLIVYTKSINFRQDVIYGHRIVSFFKIQKSYISIFPFEFTSLYNFYIKIEIIQFIKKNKKSKKNKKIIKTFHFLLSLSFNFFLFFFYIIYELYIFILFYFYFY